jgi:hypothetical protein
MGSFHTRRCTVWSCFQFTHTHINTYERKRSHVKNNLIHTFTLRLARRVNEVL